MAADLLLTYEGANVGMQWSSLYDDPLSFGRCLGMLLLDLVLYAVAAWYLEHVVPNKYGQADRLDFFLKRKYWWPRKEDEVEHNEEEIAAEGELQAEEDEELYDVGEEENGSGSQPVARERKKSKLVEPEHIERMSSHMHHRARVVINGLRKIFVEGRGKNKKSTIAVAGVTLSLYEGQVTALLGHNG